MNTTKVCKVCKQEKDASAFSKYFSNGVQVNNRECKQCFRERFLKAALKGALSYRKGAS